MKSLKNSLSLLIVAAAVLVLSGRVLSQDKPDSPGDAVMPDMATMMKKWLAAATPGPKHKALEVFVGEWDTTMKVYMGGPAAPPMETTGTASIKWTLDGHFLLQESKGQVLMPDETGQMKKIPHHGLGLVGHDNYRNMYVQTWADSNGTALLTMSGAFDPGGKVLTMYGEMDEPMLDVYGRMVKYVSRVVDANTFVFEVYDLHAGPDYKVFEITYKKK